MMVKKKLDGTVDESSADQKICKSDVMAGRQAGGWAGGQAGGRAGGRAGRQAGRQTV